MGSFKKLRKKLLYEKKNAIKILQMAPDYIVITIIVMIII